MQKQEIENSLDNKKYTHEDMVAIACNECAGCLAKISAEIFGNFLYEAVCEFF